MNITGRLRRALRPASPESRANAYLNEATSMADLESREREIERGRFHSRPFPR